MPTKATGKKRKTKSQVEKQEDKKADDQYCLHIEMQSMLKTITVRPSLWKNDTLRYLRNFCITVSNHPETFPPLMGDDEVSVHSDISDVDEKTSTPTKGYIAAVASGEETANIASHPILAVLSRKTGFHDVLRQESEKAKDHQKVKLTHLTLLDGDNNQIHARMATHIADAGRKLEEGDVIRLELFTELSYHVNEDSRPMPALFIIKYTRVARMSLPLQNEIKERIALSTTKLDLGGDGKKKASSRIIDPLSQPPPECTFENRLCRKFGVNFIGRCICDEIPVAERDLSIIAEDCHYINKPASELTENKPRRLMLYWWYATNIYSLTGKGNRGKLPDCLEYAIKQAYPETDSSKWTGYKPTPSANRAG